VPEHDRGQQAAEYQHQQQQPIAQSSILLIHPIQIARQAHAGPATVGILDRQRQAQRSLGRCAAAIGAEFEAVLPDHAQFRQAHMGLAPILQEPIEVLILPAPQ
jgi:hypothetical protein